MSCTGHEAGARAALSPHGSWRPSVTESVECSRLIQGGLMTEIQPASRERYSIRETNQRHCPKCKAGMDLAQSVPGLGHLAHRSNGAIPKIAYNFVLRRASPRSLVAWRVFGATPGCIPRLATSTAQTAPAVVCGGGFALSHCKHSLGRTWDF
jgi:hypothetical protein